MKPDSLIFDMDGTLWDAVDTYALAWNKGLTARGIDKEIDRQTFYSIMGAERKEALAYLLPEMQEKEREDVYEAVIKAQDELLPSEGGSLYKGVREGIQALSKKYPLFIVSNCSKDAICQFLDWSELSGYITDEMAHGVNSMPKHHNIRLLMDKHQLKTPFYVGDTDGDRLQSELAGVPFVFVSYGFGSTKKFDLSFDSFENLTHYFCQ
ncbi:MAG TPA: HAD family hydrolase [Flavisolibacter sp.]|nr:HAD family hydrolase [Flavisolibacter sp.]